MAIGDRLGFAGLIVGLFALAAFYFWPDKKWIGAAALGLAVLLCVGWGASEMKHRYGDSPAGFWIAILIGSLLGGLTAGISWKGTITEVAEKAESSVRAVTLHELFQNDFKESAWGINFAPRGIATNGQIRIYIEGRQLVDTNAASKFVSFFVPRSPNAFGACIVLADEYAEVGGLDLFHLEMQGPSGPIFTEKFRFSGRVFIYHEDLFTPEQSGDLNRLYKQRNLILELRGEEYRQYEQLRRETNKVAKQIQKPSA